MKLSKTRRSLGPLALVVSLTLVAAACSGGGATEDSSQQDLLESQPEKGTKEWEDFVEAAQDEGAITLYAVVAPDEAEAWGKAFTDEYGIPVDVYRATTPTVYQRWLEESRANKGFADILLISDPGVWDAAEVEELTATYVPESDEAYDDAPGTVRGHWYPSGMYHQTIGWNTNGVTPEEEKELMEQGPLALADPKWRGRIGLPSPQAFGAQWAFFEQLADEGSGYGWDFLEAVAANQPAIFESAVPTFDGLVAGEYDVVLGMNDQMGALGIANDAPIRMLFPDPAIGVPYATAINALAPRPNAARLFQTWATSEAGAVSFADITAGIPARPDIPESRDVASEAWYSPPQNVSIDWALDTEMLEGKEAFVERWNNVFDYAH